MATDTIHEKGLNEVLNSPFGVVIKKEEAKASKSDEDIENHRFLLKYGVEFDPETTRTKVIVKEKIDLVQLVASYKDECGIEAALRLIKLGRAQPEDFADDGKHGYDVTGIPDFAGDALKMLKPGIEAGQKLAEELGIPSGLKEEDLENVVKTYVEKKFNEIQAQAKAKEGVNE